MAFLPTLENSNQSRFCPSIASRKTAKIVRERQRAGKWTMIVGLLVFVFGGESLSIVGKIGASSSFGRSDANSQQF